MGDKALRCSNEFQTEHWDDNVALLIPKLAKMVGMAYTYEPRGLVPWNDLRPDDVLNRPDGSELLSMFAPASQAILESANLVPNSLNARLKWMPLRRQ
jgi:hypothetical protein